MELRILFGGRPNTEDAALLGSARMEEAVRAMREMADYVILDTAPADLLADASQLAKYVDSVLYVVRCDYTKNQQDQRRHRVSFYAGCQYYGGMYSMEM